MSDETNTSAGVSSRRSAARTALRTISRLVKPGVTLVLFTLLFRPQTFGLREDLFARVTPLTLVHELSGIDLSHVLLWLTLGFLIRFSGMMAGVVRWRLLLQGQGLKMPFWYMVQSWFVGRMFGIFCPGTTGLDGYRLYDSSLYTREPLKSATAIAVEKLIGFIALTFLVFVTFPLGFRLLRINVAILAVILFILGGFVAVSFLLLLNPRVIQVLVAVTPAPRAIRAKVDKLGAAITAYSRQRVLLLSAVAFGFWVHLSTCLMFFCTMMALRAENTNLLDILFASPIMIYGTVIGPSVGGEGIREIVFATLLGSKSGVAAAVLFGHLGWWVGDVTPFLIGLPIFMLRKRPGRKEVEAVLAETRQQVAATEAARTRIAPEAIMTYRNNLLDTVLAGAGAGLLAGATAGIAESFWVRGHLAGLTELSVFWWGPLAYGAVFLCAGAGLACGLAFLYLLFDKFARPGVTFGLSLWGSLLAATLMIVTVWVFLRNVLDYVPPAGQIAVFACVAASLAGIVGLLAAALTLSVPRKRAVAGAAVVLLYALLVGGSAVYSKLHAPQPRRVAFAPASKSQGPNILLIAADALRADYLKMYAKDAAANTPNLEALARDGIRFDRWFSQAPWTKPSFATIFTGRYPSAHTATTESLPLPQGIATFPALLSGSGYFTKGFANNPNIMTLFGFGQGFTDYVDLKPSLYFGADYSASKLALYEGLRIARQKVISKFTKKLRVTDFYQPADVVTRKAIEWLDSGERPKDAPFFLFLHYMDTHDPFMDHSKPGVGYARMRLKNPDPAEYLEPMRKAYIGDIEFLDTHLGALIDGLKKRGLYDSTVVVFTADHGEEFQDHQGWWHGQTLFDELLHVPFLIKLPGDAKAGAVNTGLARHIDIAPTLLRLAGAPTAPEMPGKAVVDAAGGFFNTDISFVFSENDFENNVMQSVRTSDAKVIHANEDNPRGHKPVECYDLKKDPREKTNLAASAPCDPAIDKLIPEMQAFVQGTAAEPAAPSKISSEQRDQLQGLGYLGGK